MDPKVKQLDSEAEFNEAFAKGEMPEWFTRPNGPEDADSTEETYEHKLHGEMLRPKGEWTKPPF